MAEIWLAVRNVASNPTGLFCLCLATLALLQSALGLGRARQWSLLPVLFGLTALAGFLLNPFADANTSFDLRAKLTSYEALTFLCIVQFLLLGGVENYIDYYLGAALSFVFLIWFIGWGYRLFDRSSEDER